MRNFIYRSIVTLTILINGPIYAFDYSVVTNLPSILSSVNAGASYKIHPSWAGQIHFHFKSEVDNGIYHTSSNTTEIGATYFFNKGALESGWNITPEIIYGSSQETYKGQ